MDSQFKKIAFFSFTDQNQPYQIDQQQCDLGLRNFLNNFAKQPQIIDYIKKARLVHNLAIIFEGETGIANQNNSQKKECLIRKLITILQADLDIIQQNNGTIGQNGPQPTFHEKDFVRNLIRRLNAEIGIVEQSIHHTNNTVITGPQPTFYSAHYSENDFKTTFSNVCKGITDIAMDQNNSSSTSYPEPKRENSVIKDEYTSSESEHEYMSDDNQTNVSEDEQSDAPINVQSNVPDSLLKELLSNALIKILLRVDQAVAKMQYSFTCFDGLRPPNVITQIQNGTMHTHPIFTWFIRQPAYHDTAEEIIHPFLNGCVQDVHFAFFDWKNELQSNNKVNITLNFGFEIYNTGCPIRTQYDNVKILVICSIPVYGASIDEKLGLLVFSYDIMDNDNIYE